MVANLPIYSTPFVGREDELRQIAVLLDDPACRLLTLLGTGGIGKTRLSIETARLHQDAYKEGVYFVPLQPLTAPEFIIPAIAEAINLQFFPGSDPKQQILDFFGTKSLLLVMDNFEHLLDSVGILSEILVSAPGVKVVTTSRERLNLIEEWVLEIVGLTFPKNTHDIPIEYFSAVQLFVERARRMRVGFAMNEAQQTAVMRICQLVGGMPLGIELASAWVRTLSCEDIASEIERSLDILSTSTRNVPARHRDMRGVLDYSWNLLTDTEQKVFAALSVFRGGFRKEAAQFVAGASLQNLSGLVDKSLLRLNDHGRYELHELLRQFGEEKLKSDPIIETQTRDRHSVFYADLLSQREDALKGRRQRKALDEITADFDNVRAAWYWMTDQKNDALVNQSAESLCLYCDMRSRFKEGMEIFGYAQAAFASNLGERTWAKLTARWVEMWRLQGGGFDSDTPLKADVEKSLAIARSYNDQSEMAACMWLLGVLAWVGPDYRESAAPFRQSLALYTALDDRFHAALVAEYLGESAGGVRDFNIFDTLTAQSIEWRRQLGDHYGLASALRNLTMAALYSGHFDEAEPYLREGDVIYRKLDNEAKLARNESLWAMIAFHRGDFEQARTLAQRTMDKASQALNSGILNALAALSLVASMDGDYAQAKRIIERIPPQDPNHDASKPLAIAACGLEHPDAQQLVVKALLDESEYRGHQAFTWLTMLPAAAILLVREDEPEQAVEILALASTYPDNKVGWMEKWPLLTQTRAKLESELSREDFAEAWERGKVSSLDEVVNGLIQRWQPDAKIQLSSSSSANDVLTDPLSERELEILRLLADGLSTNEVAQQLFLSTGTVRWYLKQIFSKLDVHNRVQALARARKLKLLT